MAVALASVKDSDPASSVLCIAVLNSVGVEIRHKFRTHWVVGVQVVRWREESVGCFRIATSPHPKQWRMVPLCVCCVHLVHDDAAAHEKCVVAYSYSAAGHARAADSRAVCW